MISGSDDPLWVSIHGGHSGQFCNHAQDSLEAVINAYIASGFSWVGITEHMPPAVDDFLYPEEREAGLNSQLMGERFQHYMLEGRRLQEVYAGQLEIFIGFESEAYEEAVGLAHRLKQRYQPDFVLAGVHHVDRIPFDASPEMYAKAVAAAGNIELLYCRYFDLQYELIQALQPQVVAHFDLIRIFDPEYQTRWHHPAIAQRIERNLALIAEMDLILDLNVAALRKGASEPYLSAPILDKVKKRGIAVVPGDDAHSAAMAGTYIAEGIALLKQKGFNLDWRKPNFR